MGRRVAPDRGYAWVVLAASVGCNYLSGVLVYFVGVIHVELLDKFQEDVTITSWAGSIYSSLQMLAAPLASWVVNRYSCRASVVVGGVLLCVGFVTSSFVTSVGQLVVTYGLIAGTGLGLTYSPSLMVVTFYFDKFRGLASGISVSGCAMGILTGSLITRAFIDTYTLKGAFLLIAGLGLQSCVFGMLYRPIDYHHGHDDDHDDDDGGEGDGGGGGEEGEGREGKTRGRSDLERRISWKAGGGDDGSKMRLEKLDSERPVSWKIGGNDEGSEIQLGSPDSERPVSWKAGGDHRSEKQHGHDSERSPSLTAGGDDGSKTQQCRHDAPEEDERRVSCKVGDDGSGTSASLKDERKNRFVHGVSVSHADGEPGFDIAGSGLNVEGDDLKEKESESKRTAPFVRSQTEATGSVHNSRADCVEEEEKEEEEEEGQEEEEEGTDCASTILNSSAEQYNNKATASVGGKTKPFTHETSKSAACHRSWLSACGETISGLGPLTKNRAFLLHCASTFFADINMGGVYLHLPEYGRTLGTENTQAAALFVGMGVFSLLSRVGSGLLLMTPWVNGFGLSVGLMATCGLASCLFPLYSATYVGQMVFASLFGLSTGGFYTLINVLTVELVDFKLLPAAYGVLIFAMGIGYLAGPPLAGLIVDNGGTYEHSFIFLGMTMFASAAFDLSAKMIHRRKNVRSS